MMLILDLDGTLFNTSARWNECEKLANGNKRMFWECFQSPRFMNLVKRVSVQFSETESKQIVASVLRFFATESKQIPLKHMFAKNKRNKNFSQPYV